MESNRKERMKISPQPANNLDYSKDRRFSLMSMESLLIRQVEPDCLPGKRRARFSLRSLLSLRLNNCRMQIWRC